MIRTGVRRWLGVGASAVCVAGLLLGQAAPASAAYPWRKPVANPLANPGVIQVGTSWTVHSTGGWKSHNVGTAAAPGGPYTVTKRALLTATPSWMSQSGGVWAPSVVQSTTGAYVVFYAALVKGGGTARCIGTGTGTDPAGPFVPNERALACWKGSGAKPHDQIASEGKNFSLIDPTPARDGASYLLTYKTQFRTAGKWHTTTRLLALDPANPAKTVANPAKAGGGSIKITDSVNKYIEENPVLVKRGSRYTLFTSWGWYGTCTYSTRYRQNAALWTGWLAKKPTALPYAKKPNTCGTGNAQILQVAGTADSWLIFFNGHTQKSTPGGPKGLYVGNLAWKAGKPRVSSLR